MGWVTLLTDRRSTTNLESSSFLGKNPKARRSIIFWNFWNRCLIAVADGFITDSAWGFQSSASSIKKSFPWENTCPIGSGRDYRFFNGSQSAASRQKLALWILGWFRVNFWQSPLNPLLTPANNLPRHSWWTIPTGQPSQKKIPTNKLRKRKMQDFRRSPFLPFFHLASFCGNLCELHLSTASRSDLVRITRSETVRRSTTTNLTVRWDCFDQEEAWYDLEPFMNQTPSVPCCCI